MNPEQIYAEWEGESHPEVEFIPDEIASCDTCLFSEMAELEFEYCKIPCTKKERQDGKEGYFIKNFARNT
jgi:hypothetical protein